MEKLTSICEPAASSIASVKVGDATIDTGHDYTITTSATAKPVTAVSYGGVTHDIRDAEAIHISDLSYKGRTLDDYAKAFDKLAAADTVVQQWKLKGVESVDDLKKAPKVMLGELLKVFGKISMHPKIMDVAYKFEQEVYQVCVDKKKKYGSMDRPAFLVALTYDTFGIGCEDEDPKVIEIANMLHSEEMTSELRREIEAVEHGKSFRMV